MITDVHTEHCCAEHGCCYGDEMCTVAREILVQSYPCEMCEWEGNEITYWLGQATSTSVVIAHTTTAIQAMTAPSPVMSALNRKRSASSAMVMMRRR